jgi:hypothetical protein
MLVTFTTAQQGTVLLETTPEDARAISAMMAGGTPSQASVMARQYHAVGKINEADFLERWVEDAVVRRRLTAQRKSLSVMPVVALVFGLTYLLL